MADLIDRAALFSDIDETVVISGRINTNAEMRGANKIIDRIKAAPTIDAEPVKHGGWIMQEDYCDDEYFECSSCKEHFYFLTGRPETNGYLFCPYCGAKMDGERKET